MNRLLARTMMAAAALALTAAAGAAEAIRFGVDPSFAPFESVDAQGQLQGIDIDFGHAICKQMQVECKWVKINFDGSIPALNARKIDAILSAMSVTQKRKEQVLFTDPLYTSTSRMMLPKSQTLDTTVESLKGKTIGVVQGSSQAAYALKHWKGKGVDLVMYQNDERARQDLAVGRVDATLQNGAAARFFFETPQGAGFHMTGTPVDDPEVFGYGAAIALRLGETGLHKRINDAIAALKANGQYEQIIAKYEKYGLIAP